MRASTRHLLCAVALLLAGCSASDPQKIPTAEERFAEAMEKFHDEDYLEAITDFEAIRLQYPATPIADSARFYSGMSRYEREEFLLGTYDFNQLIQNGAAKTLVPDAYHMLSQCYYRLSPKVPLDQMYTYQAIDALQTFIELYPDHPQAEEASKQVQELSNKLAMKEYDTAVLYMKMENREAAMICFDTVIDRYYSTDWADDAMAQKIRIHMNAEDYGKAWPLLKAFLDKFPDSPYRKEISRYREELQAVLPPGLRIN
jgi:outer membrane protein assembly factor BamD